MNKKILLVDNNPHYLKAIAELLEANGYQVIPAASIPEAMDFLESDFFHLLVSDIRLEDDSNPLDESGMEWVYDSNLAHLPKVLITAYPTYEKAEKLFGKIEAMQAKDEPAKLITKINEIFAQKIVLNWELEIVGRTARSLLSTAADYLYPLADKSHLPSHAEEIGQLFCGLFQGHKKLRLQEILWMRGHRVAFIVHLFGPSMRAESRVVICGHHDAIGQEEMATLKFAPELQGGNTAPDGLAFHSHHLSALSYRVVDGELASLVSLETCFRHKSIKKVEAILNDFYGYTLKAWHQRRSPQEGETSLEAWVGKTYFPNKEDFISVLESTLKLIQEQLPRIGYSFKFARGNIIWSLATRKQEHSNPISFFKEKIPQIMAPLANTSGYMSGRNILTDGETETWLTDFKNSGPRPFVCDYVAIEASIRYDWSDLDLESAITLETTLQKQPDASVLPQTDMDGRIKRALAAITVIRKCYFEKQGEFNAYQLGMLLQCLIRLARPREQEGLLPGDVRRLAHLFLSAGLLADSLKGRTKATPALTPTGEGIQIDKTEKTITIRGKKFKLSDNRFKFFEFLFNLEGKSASRGELGKAIWGADYDPDSKAGINLMNTNVLRLRVQIEKDPKNPEIILTTDGGYRLKF